MWNDEAGKEYYNHQAGLAGAVLPMTEEEFNKSVQSGRIEPPILRLNEVIDSISEYVLWTQNLAVNIENKLFGPTPCHDADHDYPTTLEGRLHRINNILRQAQATLQGIEEKL